MAHENGRDEYSGIYGYLSLGDFDYMRGCFEIFKLHLDETGDLQKARELFFKHTLEPYYSPIFDGLNTNVGDVVYRLSDYLTEEERQLMIAYPSEQGSLVFDDNPWDSLEDWRKQWEHNRQNSIPDFDFQHKLNTNNILELIQGIDITITG
jgi:hypothetical protein